MTITYIPKLQVRKVGSNWWVCKLKIPFMRFEMWESAVVACQALNAKEWGTTEPTVQDHADGGGDA